MYNETGNLIARSKALNATHYTTDVSKITSGVYVLRVSDDAGNVRSVKWMKE